MIELVDIHKRFGSVTAVDGVSLGIEKGEFLTLLGPSGCGKTTLLRVVAGFEMPDRGRVLLAGEDVTRLPPYRRDVNQVFQSYALFPHLDVWENVAFGLKMKRLPQREIEQRVEAALAMVSLSGMEKRRPNQLSGGQQQRVALARAVVCRPKVLLLDEPLAALDAKLRQSMQLELKALQRKLGITFVFVTHDQSEALILSDRVAVMHLGRLEQVGTPQEVYLRPRTPFVGGFVGHANLWRGQVIQRGEQYVRVRISDDVILRLKASAVADNPTSIRLLLRPERVTLRESRRHDDDFPVEVREILFTGAATQLRLHSPCGLEIHALQSPATLQPPLHQGARMFCTILPEDLVVLETAAAQNMAASANQ